jgi:hypothetical protein
MTSNSPTFPPRAIPGGFINENSEMFYKLYIGRTKVDAGVVTGYVSIQTIGNT